MAIAEDDRIVADFAVGSHIIKGTIAEDDRIVADVDVGKHSIKDAIAEGDLILPDVAYIGDNEGIVNIVDRLVYIRYAA